MTRKNGVKAKHKAKAASGSGSNISEIIVAGENVRHEELRDIMAYGVTSGEEMIASANERIGGMKTKQHRLNHRGVVRISASS